jgi:hypothetical protein
MRHGAQQALDPGVERCQVAGPGRGVTVHPEGHEQFIVAIAAGGGERGNAAAGIREVSWSGQPDIRRRRGRGDLVRDDRTWLCQAAAVSARTRSGKASAIVFARCLTWVAQRVICISVCS